MPSKKKKYNARFPPARIKKIMQKDEEVGKVAAAVPVIISRALELFIESLILKTKETTSEKNAKTLTTSHIKHTIVNERQFDFLHDLVATIPDHQAEDESEDGNHNNNKKQRAPRQRKMKDGAKPGRRKKRKESSEDSSIDNGDNENDEDDGDDTETGEEDDPDEPRKNCSASSPLDLTCSSSPGTSHIMGTSPPFLAQTRPLSYPNNSNHPFMQQMTGMPHFPMPQPTFTGFPRMAAPPVEDDDDYDT